MTEKEKNELLRELHAISNRLNEIYSMLKEDEDFNFSVTMEDKKETNKKITRVLRELGAPARHKGYGYIKEALLLCLNDPTILNKGLSKRLYPSLAETFNTTPNRVEDDIRNEILIIFRDRRNEDLLAKLFPRYSNKGHAANLEFLVTLVEYLKE